MRYLVFADVHGNIEALQALLDLAQSEKIDHYLFLGDLVGYGASPNEVIKIVSELKPLTLIRGNHDKAVAGLDSIDMFNPVAATAIKWTINHLLPESKEFLTNLKKGPLKVSRSLSICHGAPFDEDYYIFGEFDAAEAFVHLRTNLGFFGHTHFPVVYRLKKGTLEGQLLLGNAEIYLESDARYLLNPGSVGQPRDRNPLASCAIFDSEKRIFRLYRFKYDIASAQRKILAARLPSSLAERLSLGI
ncbi:MAG: metallophosphatase family protein [Candidatus Aminicenantes bacterium]|nr:metallophosphatase family protein [Candidatus Aminicenantes bacterium]